MVNKYHHFFLGSTYEDLKEERAKAFNALMSMRCFVSGMEYFPAIDQNQIEYIKKIIDDCDCYVIILGGRYGSVCNDGISFTEKEFDYAVSQGKKIIALIHKTPDSLPYEKCEKESKTRKKFLNFRKKVLTGRLVSFWNNINDIETIVTSAVAQYLRLFPDAIGWVRGDISMPTNIAKELSVLKQENDDLKKKIIELKNSDKNIHRIMNKKCIVHFKYREIYSDFDDNGIIVSTVEELFMSMSRNFIGPVNEEQARNIIINHFELEASYQLNKRFEKFLLRYDVVKKVIHLFDISNLIKIDTNNDDLIFEISDFGRMFAAHKLSENVCFFD